MIAGLQAAAVLAKLGAIATKIGIDILAAIPGGVQPDEAEALARKALSGEDIKIKVKGVDVLDDVAQGHLAAAIARVVSLTGSALAPKGGE